MPLRARYALRFVLAALLATSGCAYFNTFYHAKKYYGQAVRAQERGLLQGSTATSTYDPTGQIPGQIPGQTGQLGQTGQTASGQPASGNQAADELFRKCIEKCERVLQKHKGSKWEDDAQLLMAQSYYGRGDYLTAARELQTFITAYPESDDLPEAIYWQGLTAFAQNEFIEARDLWTGLLLQFPKYERREEVEFYVARAAWRQEQTGEAIAAYERFLDEHSGGDLRSTVQLDLAKVLREEKRLEEAAVLCRDVMENAPKEEERLEAKLLLGEVLESQSNYAEALELYREVGHDLDPNVLQGRLSPEERQTRWEEEALRLAQAQAQADTLNGGIPEVDPETGAVVVPPGGVRGTVVPRGTIGTPGDPNAALQQRQRLPANDPRYLQLAKVILREGQALAKTNQAWEAITVFQQVIEEYPRTSYAAEAQFRIGYTYEVLLEDFDAAERAYALVANHGRSSSFTDAATRRSRNLSTLKSLSAIDDSTSAHAKAAEAQFLRAELYLFQQEKPERALEEYAAIEEEFPGTDAAAKAALAQAWVLVNVMGDSTRGLDRYAEVATTYPSSEFGREARRVLEGPEDEPGPNDFAGPPLDLLIDPENLAAIAAQDTTDLETPGAELPEADLAAAAGAVAGPDMVGPNPPPATAALSPEELAAQRRALAERRRAAGASSGPGIPDVGVVGGAVAAGAAVGVAAAGEQAPGPDAMEAPPGPSLETPTDLADAAPEPAPIPEPTRSEPAGDGPNLAGVAGVVGAGVAAASLADPDPNPGPDPNPAADVPPPAVETPPPTVEAPPPTVETPPPRVETMPEITPQAVVLPPALIAAPAAGPGTEAAPSPLAVPPDGPSGVGVDASAARTPQGPRALDPMAVPADGWTPVLHAKKKS